MESAFRCMWTNLLLAFLVLALCAGAWAQGTGQITGLVTDPTGAVVSGIQVTLVNSDTAEKRMTVTSSAGIYNFPSLPIVGSYTLSISAKGFKAVKVAGIVASVGTSVNEDVKLEVGAASEQVTVEAGAELVQTTESAVSTLVDRNVWQSMPLEQRNQNSFIDLVAGAVPDLPGEGNTRGAAVNGARGGAGNYLVEGTDNNDQGQGGRGQLGGAAGGAATTISPDAIQEYRVITNDFAAEYGKAGGFVTDTVLKSGTNQWHGSLFEYNRVQALAAQHYFTSPGSRDSLVRNQFGGSVGGPIIKDKAFFYYTMEWHRLRQASPTSAGAGATTQEFLDWVDSGGLTDWAEGNAPYDVNPNPGNPFVATGPCRALTWSPSNDNGTPCTGAFAGSSALGPLFQNMKGIGPFPTSETNPSSIGQGIYTSGLVYPVPVYADIHLPDPFHLNEYRITSKVDYKLGNNDQLNAVFLFQNDDQGSPFDGGGTTIGPAYTNPGRGQDYGVTWNHTFSPTILNTAKMSYLRHRSDFSGAPSTFGIPEIVTAFDSLAVGFGQYSGFPQFFTDTQFQYQDSLSVVHGKHAFKGGVEYRRTRNGSSFFNDNNGTFLPYSIEDLVTDMTFDDEADLALFGYPAYGTMYYASASLDTTTGGPPDAYRGFRANEFASYIQDDWRLSSRLTLNLGVRWEYFGPPHNFKANVDSNVYFGNPITPIPTSSTNPYFPVDSPFYAGVFGETFQIRNHEIWNKDTNNFGPRFGFAYDVLGNQKLVVRGGFGVAYDRIFNNVFENIRFNPPYFSDNQLLGPLAGGSPLGSLSSPGVYTVPFTSTSYFGAGTHAVPNPRHMDQNLVDPYYEQYHFGFQWEFAKGYALETEYIGTLGHKLIGFRDINTFDGRRACSSPCNQRINTSIGADNYRSNDYSSNYHALQATVRKSYTNGLSFNASYTWSKAMDTMSDVFNNRTAAHPSDNVFIKNDYGPADFNLKHRVVATVSYTLPFMKNDRWIGGWSVNSIISLQGGAPFSPYTSNTGYDLNLDGYFTDRIVPGKSPMDTRTKGNPATGYINLADWSVFDPVSETYNPIFTRADCANGVFCNPPIGRNSISGPGYKNVDFGVTKSFRITERSSLKIMGNFFNLLNHPNFQLPSANLNSPSSFGISSSTFDPRITQLAARFDF
ncbi:MAG TPA: carboxypeptidase regulatory-like domain-containing protein [Terriglobales bacterium]|nr:carboxypeptidase regulatory-like domain-containing protein [Terriglobales bacterium]